MARNLYCRNQSFALIVTLPSLTFKDAFTGSDEIIAQGQSVRISSAYLVQESGRGNPDLLITRKSG